MPARRVMRWVVWIAPLLLLSACERKPHGNDAPLPPTPVDEQRVELPAQKPEYEFAAELRTQYPEVVDFVQHFLETCLAGDYTAYRGMVARFADPESRTRFERILHTLRRLQIEAIGPLKNEQLPQPAYLVIGQVELAPEDKAGRTRPRGPRRIGILVVREEGQAPGEFRIALAPRELQPGNEEPATEPASGPSTAPSYPWDEEGDS